MILIEEVDTEFGPIKIYRSRTGNTFTYYQNECFHSQANADGISTCAYVHVMHGIIQQSGARNVLMIGGAGGTLATMLHRQGCKMTVVDINPHAFVFARKYFQMPDEIECIVADGWSYIAASRNRFDAIAIDVFNSGGTIPQHFTTDEFFRKAKKLLQPSGVIAMNVMVAHDIDMMADKIALNMERAGFPTTLFDWPGRRHRNTILAGGVIEQIQVTSSNKPDCVMDELRYIVRRKAKKLAINTQ